MSTLLKSAVVSLAMAMTSPAHAKQVTLRLNMANNYGPPAYVAAYILDPKGKYVSTVLVAGSRMQYLADLRTWYRLVRRSGKGIDGVTGASIGRGRSVAATVNLPDKVLSGGYTLHVETGVEDYGVARNDVVIPLDAASNGKTIPGTRFVKSASISY